MTNQFESYPEGLRSAATQGLKHADQLEDLVSRSDALANTDVFGSDPLGLIAVALHTSRMQSLHNQLRAFPGQHRDHWERYQAMADTNESTEQNLTRHIQHLNVEV
jgi:hypothetical protein